MFRNLNIENGVYYVLTSKHYFPRVQLALEYARQHGLLSLILARLFTTSPNARDLAYRLMKILLVEDHLMFNELLSKACRAHSDVSEVVSTTHAAQAESVLRKGGCQIMILDIHLPDADGFDFAVHAIKLEPNLRILGISAHCNEYNLLRLAGSPMRGFIDKSTNTVDELHQALRIIASGSHYYSPRVEGIQAAIKATPNNFLKLLSPHEIKILRYVGMGFRDEEIGEKIGISFETVKWHRKKIMLKLGLMDRAAMVVYANKKGLAKIDDTVSKVQCPLRDGGGALIRVLEI